jgi:predicted permease
MDGCLQDVKYGWRMLWKNPAFTAIAVIVIALGIGANTAIFSLVDAVLLRPLPFADPDRLLVIWEDASFMGFPRNTPAPANFVDWKKENGVFSDMAALADRGLNLTGDGNPEKLDGYATSWNVFTILGVKPMFGRTFLPEEDDPGGQKVVLIGHGLWLRRFGGDAALVGRDIRLNDEKYRVIGVMPPGFHIAFEGKDSEVWVPLAFREQQWAQRGSHFLYVIARLNRGVSLQEARADMNVIMQRLAREYPDNNSDMGARVETLKEQSVGEVRRGLLVLLIAVACVLLIACANVANLLLSRTTGRNREIAVRTALGAGGFRVARQLLTENLLLAGVGGLFGVALAWWSFAFLQQLIPADLALAAALRLDVRVLVFTLVATVATGLLFGLAPVRQAVRLNLNEALKEGGARAGFGRSHMRNFLVLSEVALSFILLVGAVLLIRSFVNLRWIDPGFQSKGVLTLHVALSPSKYRDASKRAAFFDQALDKLRSLPGVKGLAFTSALPLVWKGGSSSFVVEGRPRPTDTLPYDANDRVVSPRYMQVIGMKLRMGRFFEETDGPQSQPVAIINETMARMYFPGDNPLSKRIKYGEYNSPQPWIMIVGVVADVKQMAWTYPRVRKCTSPIARPSIIGWFRATSSSAPTTRLGSRRRPASAFGRWIGISPSRKS